MHHVTLILRQRKKNSRIWNIGTELQFPFALCKLCFDLNFGYKIAEFQTVQEQILEKYRIWKKKMDEVLQPLRRRKQNLRRLLNMPIRENASDQNTRR